MTEAQQPGQLWTLGLPSAAVCPLNSRERSMLYGVVQGETRSALLCRCLDCVVAPSQTHVLKPRLKAVFVLFVDSTHFYR